MNIKMECNDYVLAWNLLFKSSLTDNIIETKRSIWKNYKNQYNKVFEDKMLILEDPKNFIPNNDTVYNIIRDCEDFDVVKKDAEKYRVAMIRLWDNNKKKIKHLLDEILRKPIRKYDCSIINRDFNIHETIILSDDYGRILIGKVYQDDLDFLVDVLFEIAKKEITIKETDSLKIKDAVIELATKNEFATLLKGNSCYKDGSSSLYRIKKQIYPYWLMYLGVQKEDMVKYMMRDKIAFEVKNFAYEKELVNMNIEEFIEFIIRNQRYIIRDKKR